MMYRDPGEPYLTKMSLRASRPLIGAVAALLLASAAMPVAAQEVPVAPAPVVDPATAARMENQRQLTAALTRLATNGTDVAALSQAGRAALALGDPRAALGFLARAEQLAPRDPVIKAALGATMVQLEDPQQAMRFFESAISLGGLERAYLADRGLAFDLLGDQVRAQADYAAAAQFAPTPEVMRRHAISLGISGNSEAAIQLLGPLLRAQDRAAWRSRAMIVAMNGRADEARQIAAATMPAQLAAGLSPYFAMMDRLTPPQLAAAAHFGRFPSYEVVAAQPVRSGRRVESAAARTAASPARTAARTSGRRVVAANTGGSARTAQRTRTERQAVRPTPTPIPVPPIRVTELPPPSPPRVRTAQAAPVVPPPVTPRAVVPAPATPTPVAPTSITPTPVTPTPVVPTPVVPTQIVPPVGPTVVAAPPGPTPGPAPTPTPGASLTPTPGPVPVQPAVAEVVRTAAITPPPVTPAAVTPPPVSPTPVLPAVAIPAATAPAATLPAAVVPAEATTVSATPMGPPDAGIRPGLASLPPIQPPAVAPPPAQPTITSVELPPSTLPPANAEAAMTPVPVAPPANTVVVSGWSLADMVGSITVPESERQAEEGALSIEELDRIAAERRRVAAAAAAEARRRAAEEARTREAGETEARARTEREAEERAEAEARRRHPPRVWVQVATGADAGALASDYRRFSQRSAEVFRGQSGHTAVWNRTRRLVVGPFANAAAARSWLNRYTAAGGQGFIWNSEQGQEVTPLSRR
jgi:Flp pilus assembly protein TadD